MVYTTVPLKIIVNPSQQPISVGGEEGVPTGIGNLPSWLLAILGQGGQQLPPINVGVPSTGTETGEIEEPPGNVSCPAGYALNNQNQCVLIPIGSGLGDITQVQVPTTTAKGGQAIIKTWFKNNHTVTLEYNAQIIITGLSINVTSPALSVAAGQTAMIETTVNVPTTIPDAVYAGVVQLRASSTTTTGFVLQDTESFGLGVGTASGGGGGGTGTATIVASAVSVKQGQSVSVITSGFAASEIVDYMAKVGSTIVANDTKTMDVNGTALLNTLTFSSSSALGTAVITATGRTSGRIATQTITVISSSTTGGGGTTTAAISASASSVQQGKSVAVACSNFTPGEIVDITAKVGTTLVATDNHQMGTSGSGTEPDLTFSTGSPLGTAIITAKGRVSQRTATVTVTVLAATASPTASIVASVTSIQRGGSFSIQCSGFGSGEVVDFTAKVGSTTVGTDSKTAGITGAFRLDTMVISSSSPTGTATITARGRTTNRAATDTVTITAPTSGGTTTTARISAPSSIHDGDTFRVTGTGFKGGERVTTTVSGTWKGGSYNGRTYSRSFTVTASSSGSFAVNVSTPEVPSGVSSIATIRSKGLTSGRTASRTISII